MPLREFCLESCVRPPRQRSFHQNLTMIDPLSNQSYVLNTTIGFDYSISSNAIDDFYTRSLIKQKDIEKEIIGMEMGYFSFTGVTQDLINPTQPDLKLFNSPTKAVAVWNGGVSICEDGLLFDVVSKSCVSSCKDGSARYQSACLAACPKNFFFVTILNVNHCYLKCPTQLGYVPPTDASSKCRLCSISQSVTESGCVSPSETAGMVKFGSGFFAQCPDGLTLDCKEPTSCPDGQYFVNVSGHPLSLANNRELFSHCSPSPLAGAGMLRLITFDGTDKKLTNVFTWSCPFGTRFANQTCLTSEKYTPKATDCDIQDIKQIPNKVNGGGIACDAICMNSLVNSSSACSDSCVGPLYKQTAFGACNPCQSEAYDKGTYFQEQTKMCALFCDYYTVAKPKEAAPKICKVSCSANEKIVNRIDSITKKANKQCVGNCSDVDMLEVNGICVSTCPNLLDVTGKMCVTQCGSDETIDTIKKQCTKCATQTLDDGSITPNCFNCKYFDTKYDPPMCVDSCKIYYTKDEKQYCVDKCPSGTYLNTKNLTSTCVASCAAEERYVGANNTCVDSCKVYTIVGSEQVCSDICSDEQLVIDDKVICYKDCGAQISAPSGCVDEQCPTGFYEYMKICLTACPKGYTIYNNRCVSSSQKNSTWIYIVIFVVLFVVVLSTIIILYVLKKKNQKKSKQTNSIGKDTMYYARRIQQKKAPAVRNQKIKIGQQMIDETDNSKLGTSINSQLSGETNSSSHKKNHVKIKKIKEFEMPESKLKGKEMKKVNMEHISNTFTW
ncbi:transmembrane_receptor protein [Hexamita inflata]|uniref:Transmembrane receptor protein n=1 Tax=Hexamita inflata TaxID=28002 RepID=A0AA86UA61_9EUKA|nr:transmembrane receptor protein [Hexamita inflata]